MLSSTDDVWCAHTYYVSRRQFQWRYVSQRRAAPHVPCHQLLTLQLHAAASQGVRQLLQVLLLVPGGTGS
jgi:hypothetical protein